MDPHSTQQTSGSEAVAKIATPAPRRGYNLAGVQLVAYRLDPGESLYLSHPRMPEVKLLVQGQHFDFLPPYKGRPGDARDAMFSQFTAKVPLLVAIHGPRGSGKLTHARSLGHIRAARDSAPGFGIVRELLQEIPDMLRRDPRSRYGCKDGHYPEHLALGGPLGAVAYRDEIVVPGYNYEEGVRDSLPFTYIVERSQEDLIAHAFSRGAQQAWAIREGRKVQPAVAVAGKMRTGNLGPVAVEFDAVGRVHGIKDGEKSKPFLTFKNGASLRVGEIITHPAMRLELGLEVLATTVVTVSPVTTMGPVKREKLPGMPKAAVKAPEAAPAAVAAPAAPVEAVAAPAAVEATAVVEAAPVEEPAPAEVAAVVEVAPVVTVTEPAPVVAVKTAPVVKTKPAPKAKQKKVEAVQAPAPAADPTMDEAVEAIFQDAMKKVGTPPDIELLNGQSLVVEGEVLTFDKAQYVNEAVKAKMVYETSFNKPWIAEFCAMMKGL